MAKPVIKAAAQDLDQVCRSHEAGLRAIVRKAGGDEADLAQDACLRLVETARRETVAAPGRLLYRIARNLMIDRLRLRARSAAVFQEEGGYVQHASPTPDPERALLANERLKAALQVIDAMPERRREAFLLHRMDGLTYPQIARRMGVSIKAVEKHMSAAMLQLHQGMQSDAAGD